MSWKPDCKQILTIEESLKVSEAKKKGKKLENMYCKRCDKHVLHELLGEGYGNSEWKCSKCDFKKFLMQSFDYDLM